MGLKTLRPFIKTFEKIDTDKLEDTIPDFHNGLMRYAHLEEAYAQAKPERIQKAQHLYDFAKSHKVIFDEVKKAVDEKRIPIRVTHNDTKINNVLIHNDNPNDFKEKRKKIIRFFANFEFLVYLCKRNIIRNDSNVRRTVSRGPL